jgi:DNA-binding response OmpR family regulator
LAKVLIVEDDEAMAAAHARDGFAFEGFAVQHMRATGRRGSRWRRRRQPDIVHPRCHASEDERTRRLQTSCAPPGHDVPIIMVTGARTRDRQGLGAEARRRRLRHQAFGFMELMARVEALPRRAAGRTARSTDISSGTSRSISRRPGSQAGALADLSRREYSPLQYFIEHAARSSRARTLLDACGGLRERSLTRTVDMHVAKLRKKIEDMADEPNGSSPCPAWVQVRR